MEVKGYKGFDESLKCRDFQYEIGKTYKHEGKIEVCEEGFHFCKKLSSIHNYYNLNDEGTRVCEIIAIGDIKEKEDKCATNEIQIVRELSKEEIEILKNEGIGNSGIGNTGDWNTGNWNTGNCNTGNCNTGNGNTGNCNTGNGNTGNWNKTNRSAGVFCNEEPKLIMFNKETDMTWEEWKNSKAYDILARKVKSVWICYNDMTDEEKEKNPSAKTCDGYLKEIEMSVSSKEWWSNLEMHEKATIIQLPNFNLDIFNDIMEFEVSKDEYEEILEWINGKM